MTLPHTSAQALRALVELPGHSLAATAQATGLLGQDGVQGAVAEIGAALLLADAFNPRWIAVTYWEHGGRQLQAISRFWPSDGVEYRTELSLVSECYGGYAAVLSQTILNSLTPEERRAASQGAISPLSPDTTCVIIRGPYRIVCTPASMVLQDETTLGEELNCD